MARRTAMLPVSAWNDDSFTGIGVGPQWLYVILLSERTLSPAGIVPTLPRRWSCLTRDVSTDDVLGWLDELQEAGWAYTDHEYQETFVSGFFEAEQIARQPRRVVGALDAIPAIGPAWLRAVVSAELGALISAAPLPHAPRGIRAKVLERDGYRCLDCGWMPGDPVPTKEGTSRPVFRTLELDHIWPKSTTCNCRKGART